MRPSPGQVLHFSEDPTIKKFAPHVAKTAQQPEAYVWAVTWDRAPDYWFPRQCPRAMAWSAPWTTAADEALLSAPAQRTHAIEYHWLDAVRSTKLYAYRFDEADFRPFGDPKSPHAMVAEHAVTPLAPAEPVGDLLALHDEAGIELRLLPNLWPFWDKVTASTLDFSAIRMHNARARPQPRPGA